MLAGRRWRHLGVAGAAALVLLGALGAAPLPAGATTHRQASAAACPWLAEPHASPAALAAQVASRMSLADEVEFLVLTSGYGGYENENTPIPGLCLPWLTLEDGADGIAFLDRGVTQMPASIATAASFDPAAAHAYGQVLGQEAAGQGLEVVQAPDLNLVRVPFDGESYETFGEDPYLASVMGQAEIGGIQSEGVMSDAVHLGVYEQETDRSDIDALISRRSLEEVYLAPFRAAAEANVASFMCATGETDGYNNCADPTLAADLAAWGFGGFVRSEEGCACSVASEFLNGVDLVKRGIDRPPVAAWQAVISAVQQGQLPASQLREAVERVLTEMFAFGVIQHPLHGHPLQPVETPADRRVALQVAEEGAVLLKDEGGALPLASSGQIAVIGPDAGVAAQMAGGGSPYVIPTDPITPIQALEQVLGPRMLTADTSPSSVGAKTIFQGSAPPGGANPHGWPLSAAFAIAPESGPNWHRQIATFDPPASGTYQVTVAGFGDTWLWDGSNLLLAERGGPSSGAGPETWSVAASLTAGQPASFQLAWFGPWEPQVTVSYVQPLINQAIQAAAHSAEAVVFASDQEAEGWDRPTVELPGCENALIEAVAKANPRTVVVLNTGGAVVMPWLSRVAAVLQMWYPGEMDGPAVAAVLEGTYDPSGRLPITFPTGDTTTSVSGSPAAYPGIAGKLYIDGMGQNGLAIGYRWYEETHTPVLFPFGFGLSYTSFSLSGLSASMGQQKIRLQLKVTNTGAVAGTEVVQAYVTWPPQAGEPAPELRAFGRIELQPGKSGLLTMEIPLSGLQVWLNGGWRLIPGQYLVSVGTSSASLPLTATLRI